MANIAEENLSNNFSDLCGEKPRKSIAASAPGFDLSVRNQPDPEPVYELPRIRPFLPRRFP
jgi:hypothetical protein